MRSQGTKWAGWHGRPSLTGQDALRASGGGGRVFAYCTPEYSTPTYTYTTNLMYR